MSFIRNAYQKLLSQSVRVKLWRARNRIRNWPVAVKALPRRTGVRLFGRCKACQGTRLSRFNNSTIALLPFFFYKCADCGFMFALPPTNLSEIYTEETTPEFGSGEEIWNRHYLDVLNRARPEKGKILEVGFGNASFLKLAHTDGWDVYGAELSELHVKHASETLKLPNISLGTVERLSYPDNFFDAVAGFNFLEHVPDPLGTAQELRRILKPSGVAILMCPNIGGIFHRLMPEVMADNDPLKITWVPPEHLSYFNKSNLKKLLECAGFQIIGDESRLMSSLWRQFEVSLGPEITSQKLQELLSSIRSFAADSDEVRLEKFYPSIKNLMVERMTWTMLADLMLLEPLLGAEVGALIVARNADHER